MSDKVFDLEKIMQQVSKVKLPGGVVGKICKVLIIVAVCIAAIAWSVKIVWTSLLAIIFIFVLSFCTLWRLITFADRNPKAALLEGAEFLLHEQLVKLGAKNSPEITVDPKNVGEFRPVSSGKQAIDAAKQPDTPVPSSTPEDNEGGANNG